MAEVLHVDVLVVGLGPAGASAAHAAARGGLKVLAVDRKSVIGVPVQCAEYIPLTIARHARTEGIRQQGITSMRTWMNRQAAITSEVPGLIIDRGRFDQALAAAAEDAGARIERATRLHRLAVQERMASLVCGSRTYRVYYQHLVAADGPRSVVARELGLAPLETIYSYQLTVPLLEALDHTEVWHDERFPGGYGWLFPRGKEANLGAAGYPEMAGRVKTGLATLHRQLVDEGRVGRETIRATGGLIPVGGMRASLVVDGILFAGDAAGLCHPITGAGIASAVDSGFAAGEAIVSRLMGQEPEALQEYQTEMSERYGRRLSHARDRRRWLQRWWRDGKADDDTALRRAWIAFPEYFESTDEFYH